MPLMCGIIKECLCSTFVLRVWDKENFFGAKNGQVWFFLGQWERHGVEIPPLRIPKYLPSEFVF